MAGEDDRVSAEAIVYMALLALQFGCQPLLNKSFLSRDIIRTTPVLIGEVRQRREREREREKERLEREKAMRERFHLVLIESCANTKESVLLYSTNAQHKEAIGLKVTIDRQTLKTSPSPPSPPSPLLSLFLSQRFLKGKMYSHRVVTMLLISRRCRASFLL
jgi:hypothetical protein